MSDLRTAAQQALGRLRMYYYGTGFAEDAECIAALEAALAQQDEPVEPVQEPEGLDWRYTARIGYVVKPYTAPPQRKPQTLDDAMQQPRVMAQAYENGYKAGAAAEREACCSAEVLNAANINGADLPHQVYDKYTAAIRARGNK